MGRYNFLSPGSAATEGILEIAQKQKDEARQAALDAIAAQNAQANREATAQQIAASKIASEGNLLGQVTPGLERNQDISHLPQNIQDLLISRGRVGPGEKAPAPSVSTEIEGQPETEFNEAPKPSPAPPSQVYTGSPEDRTRERRRNNVGNIIQFLQDPNLSQMQKMVMYSQAMEDDSIPTGIYSAMRPESPVYRYDPEHDTTAPLVDPTTKKPITTQGDSHVITRSRPPRELREPAPQYVGTDEKGRPIGWANGGAYVTDESGKRIPYHGPMGAKPSAASGRGRATINSGLLTNLSTWRAKVEAVPGLIWGSTPPTPANAAGYAQALQGIVSSYQTTPTVREMVRDILRDPSSDQYTTTEILEGHEGKFQTPEEQNQFIDLLTLLRGND